MKDTMREHELKTWPPYFEAVLEGRKTFEIRRDDRGFGVGDTLLLKEWDPRGSFTDFGGRYTLREIRCRVVYIVHGGQFGLSEHTCVMAIKLISSCIEGEAHKPISSGTHTVLPFRDPNLVTDPPNLWDEHALRVNPNVPAPSTPYDQEREGNPNVVTPFKVHHEPEPNGDLNTIPCATK